MKKDISYLLLMFLGFQMSCATPEPLPKTINFSKLTPGCENTDITFYKLGALGFNGAPEISSFIAYLKKTYNLDVVIETGTFRGNTSIALSYIFDKVYTIEILPSQYQATQANLKELGNITLLQGSSDDVLSSLLPNLINKRPLFYLDAHWNEHWPLLNEIKTIGKTHKDNCVIIIDDVLVPGHPELHADSYKGQVLSYEYIKDVLPLAFTEYTVHYIIPKETESRGKIIIIPINL